MIYFTSDDMRDAADYIDPKRRNLYGPAAMLRQAADDAERLESIYKAYDKSTNGGGANTFVSNLVIAIDAARKENT